jgi:hypothetical protein
MLDLRSVSSDGRHFIVKVQRQKQYHFKKRSLLYLAREYSNSTKKGELLINQKFNIKGEQMNVYIQIIWSI